jgi:alkylhydroperoxidase family enzyme
MHFTTILAAGLALGQAAIAVAADPPTVPATRTDLKQTLEGSKRSSPRLPLPPTDAREKGQANNPGGLGVVNNGRMRQFYIPRELNGGGARGGGGIRGGGGNATASGVGAARDGEMGMTLDNKFKTMLFWIVSRANNCYYCMGHQEVKLAGAGLTDDQIAALDCDWSAYSEAERAAFALTKKLTNEPFAVTDADVEAVRRHYTDAQVLEIILTVAGDNATNRWTGGLAIPQEEHRVFLTPTSERYRDQRSLVAPLDPATAAPGSAPSCARPAQRPPLGSRADVEAALAVCRTRAPRLEVLDESKARAALGPDWAALPLPQWVRLFARFPRSGVARIASLRAAEEKGTLPPLLKAQMAWIAARNDRAWYALGYARRRLASLGQTAEAIFALDGSWESYAPAERAAFSLARKLTVDPALVEDDDVAVLRKHFSDNQVAEIVYQITNYAFFDRVTEASGLRLEAETAQR